LRRENCFCWTPWVDHLRELAAKGISASAIAAIISTASSHSVTRSSVSSKCKQAGIALLTEASARMPAEKCERFKEMWAAGFSYDRIGAALGMTRSAVAGKRKRLKLAPRVLVTSKPRAQKPRVPQTHKPGRFTREGTGFLAPSIGLGAPEPPPLAHEPLQRSRPAVLLDLEAGQCRWPLKEETGVAGRWLMCGGPKLDECPYCWQHAEMAYAPVRARRAA